MLQQRAQIDSIESNAASAAERWRAAGGGKRISLHNYAAFFALADAGILVIAGVVLGLLIDKPGGAWLRLADWQVWAIGFALFTHWVMAQMLNVYSTTTIFARNHSAQRVLLSFCASFMVMLVIAVATKTSEAYSRLWFFSWLCSSLSLVLLVRLVVLEHVRKVMADGAYVYKALSIGVFCDPVHADDIQDETNNEVRVVETLRLASLDEVALLSDQIAGEEIDRVYIATLWEDIPVVLRNMHLLRHLSTRVFVMPGGGRSRLNVENVQFLGDRPLFCAIEEPIHGWSLWLKRLEDIVISSTAIALLSPALAAVALAVKLDSRGPMLFGQVRAGFNGRTFKLWKFRSMYVEDTDDNAERQTSKDDPRVTRVGRFIRRTSLDELPQLFNVLKGDMSIVGPRPHALSTKTEGRNLEELVDYYAVRHRVRPGMTGWAQVHGLRGELDSLEKLQKRVDYDIDYIDDWTIWLDLKIIVKTALLVFHDPKAY